MTLDSEKMLVPLAGSPCSGGAYLNPPGFPCRSTIRLLHQSNAHKRTSQPECKQPMLHTQVPPLLIQVPSQCRPVRRPGSASTPFMAQLPALLEGVRCYSDASTAPDLPTLSPRPASIGLFIINTQVNPVQTIYIKARMIGTTSVLMAEAAAIALAAVVTQRLNLQQVHFLSDNQQLVHFLNASDQANPPEWRVKPFTQMFTNSTTNTNKTIRKIHRSQNQTADTLAPDRLFHSLPISLTVSCSCSYGVALSSALLNHVTLLSAACC